MIFILDQTHHFPPPHLAESDGLLAMGGDLEPDRLLLAYRQGIFPWYDGDTILWWSPDPRFILFPEELKIAKSLRPLLNRSAFRFTINKAFGQVIDQCQKITRPGQEGTWITPEVKKAYSLLHEMGYAHSAEVWNNGELVGGLYGVKMGKVFFGESMFSKESNASRYAFVKYCRQLASEGVELIDCQVHTEYLESMGAKMVEGKDFRRMLEEYIG